MQYPNLSFFLNMRTTSSFHLSIAMSYNLKSPNLLRSVEFRQPVPFLQENSNLKFAPIAHKKMITLCLALLKVPIVKIMSSTSV